MAIILLQPWRTASATPAPLLVKYGDCRVRGETRSPKRIDDLIAGMNSKSTNAGKIMPALEIQPLMVNIKTYLDLSDPHRFYKPPVQRDAALTTQVHASSARQVRLVKSGEHPRAVPWRESQRRERAPYSLCKPQVPERGQSRPLDPKCLTILADITKLDPIKHGFKPGQFQLIWSSIPSQSGCTPPSSSASLPRSRPTLTT